jgi:hypothetical protein
MRDVRGHVFTEHREVAALSVAPRSWRCRPFPFYYVRTKFSVVGWRCSLSPVVLRILSLVSDSLFNWPTTERSAYLASIYWAHLVSTRVLGDDFRNGATPLLGVSGTVTNDL